MYLESFQAWRNTLAGAAGERRHDRRRGCLADRLAVDECPCTLIDLATVKRGRRSWAGVFAYPPLFEVNPYRSTTVR